MVYSTRTLNLIHLKSLLQNRNQKRTVKRISWWVIVRVILIGQYMITHSSFKIQIQALMVYQMSLPFQVQFTVLLWLINPRYIPHLAWNKTCFILLITKSSVITRRGGRPSEKTTKKFLPISRSLSKGLSTSLKITDLHHPGKLG